MGPRAQRLSPFWMNIANSLYKRDPLLKAPLQPTVLFPKPPQPGSEVPGK